MVDAVIRYHVNNGSTDMAHTKGERAEKSSRESASSNTEKERDTASKRGKTGNSGRSATPRRGRGQ